MFASPNRHVLVFGFCVLLSACGSKVKYPDSSNYGSYNTDPKSISFKDNVESNAPVVDDLTVLSFLDSSGKEVSLKDYVGKKNVVLVITRGYSGSICLYCSTQTSRLISRYKELADLGAEVVVVFPVNVMDDKARLEEFIASTKEKLDDPSSRVPFPVLLDVQLKAVDQLDLRQSLSKPATYILDKKGQVHFAYVGSAVDDRPSVDAIIQQLKQLSES